jgi:short-subunit dehydrogenase
MTSKVLFCLHNFYDVDGLKTMIAPFRNLLAAGVAACAASFSFMDANPALYLFDKFFVNDKRLHEHFQGKNIWILGASSGIGAEVARKLSQHGANLILSSRSSERLEIVAESCRRNTNKVSLITLDVAASQNDLETAVDQALEIVGSANLDCVILNAGRGQLAPAKQTTRETTEQIFQINTLAPIHITQILFQRGALHQDKGKHLFVTSSIGAKFAVPLSASYAASKHALHGYFNSLQAENPWLRIDLLCLGPVDTSFHKNHIDSSRKDTHAETETTNNPQSDNISSVRELKMPVQRCASLFVSSMLMSNGSNNERWVSEQPALMGMYINQYFPGLFHRLVKGMGPIRVQAWKEGKNLYDPNTWTNRQTKAGFEKRKAQ